MNTILLSKLLLFFISIGILLYSCQSNINKKNEEKSVEKEYIENKENYVYEDYLINDSISDLRQLMLGDYIIVLKTW